MHVSLVDFLAFPVDQNKEWVRLVGERAFDLLGGRVLFEIDACECVEVAVPADEVGCEERHDNVHSVFAFV